MARRILIIGGVAGGSTCAARLRRLDESLEIHVYDKGPHVAFANCGLPYYVGEVITQEKNLLVATPELFHQRFNVDVHTRHEVTAIDRAQRRITVKDLASGESREEAYDALVLAPGAAPIKPPIPGIDSPGIFTVRSIPDTHAIRAWIAQHEARDALIVGGGFIGLEMAENLHHRGMNITVLTPILMPPLDPEMVQPLLSQMQEKGVQTWIPDEPVGFEPVEGGVVVRTKAGREQRFGLVILAIGVRPETRLAQAAGLALGPRGGILVDGRMRTSDPYIWAAGDAVEARDVVTGQELVLPLAGPAQRQARTAADAICGRAHTFRGVQGTAVVGLFGLVAAATGANEAGLKRAGITRTKAVWLHPGHHAGYFPGARPIHLKLIFSEPDGRILGAQAVGEEGVEKRIDVIATHIQHGGTVRDLAEAELCYAPQFGAAKDPVNMAGMIASNHLDGDLPLADWEKAPFAADHGAVLVDVREPAETARGHAPGALLAPLSTLRERYAELPKDKELWLLCGVGQRAWYATRFLAAQGFKVRHLSGGMTTWSAMFPDSKLA